MKIKTIASFLIGVALSTSVFVYAQETSGSTSFAGDGTSSEDTGSTTEAAAADDGGGGGETRPEGIPGNFVYYQEVQAWGPPGNPPGGTTSAPPATTAPVVGGTPSCPTSGQTCNGDYIYDHSIACGVGGNTTYCSNGCVNNGGTATNFGAYWSVAPLPTVYLWFTAN